MKINIFHAGYCSCPENIAIRGGARRHICFPAMFALLQHPRFGASLFDTGYSFRFFDAIKKFPYKLYGLATPVILREEELAVNQLSALGLRPSDIERIFISHFHADHIAALADFDKARYVYLPAAYDSLRFTRGFGAVRRAFLPNLIPNDFDQRAEPIHISNPRVLPKEYAPFTQGCDLFGDESAYAVELPGHAPGQMGIIARDDNDKTFFFVADAAWLRQSYMQYRPPHWLANFLFPSPKIYRGTLLAIQSFYKARPDALIIPSHCEETLSAYSGRM